MLNYPVAVIFIAMAIASLAAGPGNWPNLPFLILMAVLFVRESKERVLDPRREADVSSSLLRILNESHASIGRQ